MHEAARLDNNSKCRAFQERAGSDGLHRRLENGMQRLIRLHSSKFSNGIAEFLGKEFIRRPIDVRLVLVPRRANQGEHHAVFRAESFQCLRFNVDSLDAVVVTGNHSSNVVPNPEVYLAAREQPTFKPFRVQ